MTPAPRIPRGRSPGGAVTVSGGRTIWRSRTRRIQKAAGAVPRSPESAAAGCVPTATEAPEAAAHPTSDVAKAADADGRLTQTATAETADRHAADSYGFSSIRSLPDSRDTDHRGSPRPRWHAFAPREPARRADGLHAMSTAGRSDFAADTSPRSIDDTTCRFRSGLRWYGLDSSISLHQAQSRSGQEFVTRDTASKLSGE